MNERKKGITDNILMEGIIKKIYLNGGTVDRYRNGDTYFCVPDPTFTETEVDKFAFKEDQMYIVLNAANFNNLANANRIVDCLIAAKNRNVSLRKFAEDVQLGTISTSDFRKIALYAIEGIPMKILLHPAGYPNISKLDILVKMYRNGLDTSIILEDPSYTDYQLFELYDGMAAGFNMKKYADPKAFSSSQLTIINSLLGRSGWKMTDSIIKLMQTGITAPLKSEQVIQYAVIIQSSESMGEEEMHKGNAAMEVFVNEIDRYCKFCDENDSETKRRIAALSLKISLYSLTIFGLWSASWFERIKDMAEIHYAILEGSIICKKNYCVENLEDALMAIVGSGDIAMLSDKAFEKYPDMFSKIVVAIEKNEEIPTFTFES